MQRQTRDVHTYTRLRPREREWVERMAEMERRTISDMLRQLVVEGAVRRGLVSKELHAGLE